MKLALLSAIAMTLSLNAMASTKTCYGSTKNDETKGVIISAEISKAEVTIKALKGDTLEGTFETDKGVIQGRDGKTYLTYDAPADEYAQVIMVDKDLLKEGTTGLLQVRARGEGFFNSVFVCR